MGSGNSKVVIRRASPVVHVNGYDNCIVSSSSEPKLVTEVNKPTVKAEERQSQQTDKNANHRQEVQSPPVEEIEVKPVSKTLKKTEEKLQLRGFTDPTLVAYCDETPALLEEFIELYEQVQIVKSNLGEEDFIALIKNPIYSISLLYSKERPDKIKKGNILSDIGFAEVYKEIMAKLIAKFPTLLSYDRELDQSENKDDDSIKQVKKAQDCLATIFILAVNYTDLCDAINLAFSKVGLVAILVDMVEKLKDCTVHNIKYMDSCGILSKKTVRGNCLSRSLGTLHNMSKRVPTRANFHACNAVTVILPLINDQVTLFATKALLTLAYLIDETNNELVMANKGPIKFLISSIEKATQNANRRYLGFSTSELAEGLTQIAINDGNKKLIVANGALPILTTMIIKAIHKEEKIEGVGAFWVLAFDEDNRRKMRETEGLVDLLKSLKHNDNDAVQKAASGALWELEGKHDLSRSSADLMNTSATRNHVMISYQWDVQKTMIQLKNRLQAAGFRVWIDLEQMGGSTLEAMARAVEDSAVVLVCVSQKYKESSNCRSEAEYAFQLKKDIIPLMMEGNYRPDGWLGMIMGSKLWIDLSQGQRKLDTSFRDLAKELGDRGKGGEELVEAINVDVVDSAPAPAPSTKTDISVWTNKDVMAWISGFGLEIRKKNSLKKLNGPLLSRLHSLRIESPDYYHWSLKEDIGLYDVYNVLLFTDELEKLVG